MKTWHTASVIALATGCYSGLGGHADVDRTTNGDGTIAGDEDPGDDAHSEDDADSEGEADSGGGEADTGGEPGQEDMPALVALSGARRLTPTEYVDTLQDLLGVDAAVAHTLLPTPDYLPFDNDYTVQTESAALVVGFEALARQLVTLIVEDPSKLQDLVDCPVDGPADAACFDRFLRDFGRRALRRPLADSEIAVWSTSFLAEAAAAGRFSVAVELALQTFLQHPELLYRIDRGVLVDGSLEVVRLDDWAVASRLSYLLWGSCPDDELLDVAAAGGLQNPAAVAVAVERMLDDERAHARIERFHAMWMGFEVMPIGGVLGDAMLAETGALLRRVIFEDDTPWQDVFRADTTFLTPTLAEHYGLPAPTNPAGSWVDYGDSGRGGILSHGTFLSNGFKDSDTSPTLRGLAIRTKLLCQDVPPPPPNVNDSVPDAEASPDAPCKIDRYAAHRTEPSCATCHVLMDGIGFGLENYDQVGKYRAHDPDHPECLIDGQGDVPGFGTFQGPAELGVLLADSEELGDCALRQAYRFSVGRTELDEVDLDLIARLEERVGTQDFRFRELVLEHVSDPSFGFARRH